MPREIEPHHVNNVGKYINDKPLTIRALARKLRCSYQAAKRRLEAWSVEEGVTLSVEMVREGERGSPSKAFKRTA